MQTRVVLVMMNWCATLAGNTMHACSPKHGRVPTIHRRQERLSQLRETVAGLEKQREALEMLLSTIRGTAVVPEVARSPARLERWLGSLTGAASDDAREQCQQ